MAKRKIAIFLAKVAAPKGEQEGLVCITIPDDTSRTWQYIFTYEDCAKQETVVLRTSFPNFLLSTGDLGLDFIRVHQWRAVNCDFHLQTPEISAVCDDYAANGKIVLSSRIDKYLIQTKKLQGKYESASYDDLDLILTTSLNEYIKKNFSLSEELCQEMANEKNNTILRPLAFKKDHIDWAKTWDSPILTKEQKDILRARPDLEIIYSNRNRACRARFAKEMETVYPSRDYTLIGLHGNPSSGKTKMVVNDYCAINHIPVIYIPCDCNSTIRGFLAQTGPEKFKVDIDNATLEQLYKIAMDMLTSDEDKIKGAELLQKYYTLAFGDVKLGQTLSIWATCFIHNLPLVVFFDEFCLLRGDQIATVSPIISDHVITIGPKTYRNDNTIKYVIAWNPTTVGSKAWDDKFENRLHRIAVEDISDVTRADYFAKTMLADMYSVEDNKEKEEKVKEYIENEKWLSDDENSSKNKELDLLYEEVKPFFSEASLEAILYYVDYRVAVIKEEKRTRLSVNDSSGNYSPVFLDEITKAGKDMTTKACEEVVKYISSVNEILAKQTKGIDSRNQDPNACFYIPQDRAKEIFVDYILGYKSTEAATTAFICDLLPGGFTLRYKASVGNMGAKDETPKQIALGITTSCASLAKSLDGLFFKILETVDAEKVEASYKTWGTYQPSVWLLTQDEAETYIKAKGSTAAPTGVNQDPKSNSEAAAQSAARRAQKWGHTI